MTEVCRHYVEHGTSKLPLKLSRGAQFLTFDTYLVAGDEHMALWFLEDLSASEGEKEWRVFRFYRTGHTLHGLGKRYLGTAVLRYRGEEYHLFEDEGREEPARKITDWIRECAE